MFDSLRKRRRGGGSQSSPEGTSGPSSGNGASLQQRAGNQAVASLVGGEAGSPSDAVGGDRALAGALAREAAAEREPPPVRGRGERRKRRHAGAGTEATTTREDGTTTRSNEATAWAGMQGSSKREADVFDGTTQRTSTVEHEGLLGAEAAAKVIRSSSPDEIKAAVEAMARAGAFADSSRKAAITRGKASASAEGSASGMVGATTEAKASATLEPDLFHALAVAIELGAKAGAETDLAANLQAGFGPLSVGLESKLSAFAGAMASCKATLDVGITHLYATLEASGFVGARGSASAEAKAKLGPAELQASLAAAAMAGAQFEAKGDVKMDLTHLHASGEASASAGAKGSVDGKAAASVGGAKAAVEGGVEGMAGAEAEASGDLKIDLTGVEASGKLEAFAGAQAALKGASEVSFRGVPIAAAKGRVGVSAGVGGSVEGAFAFRRGKLHISGDLVAAFEVGEVAGLDVELDFFEFGRMFFLIGREAYKRRMATINRTAPDVRRVPIIDPVKQVKTRKQGYEAYLKDFAAYDRKKAKQGESGIKRERVQEIIDNRRFRYEDQWQFLEFDEGIITAAKDAFGSKLRHIDIQAGQIRAFDVARSEAQKEHISQQRRRQGAWF